MTADAPSPDVETVLARADEPVKCIHGNALYICGCGLRKAEPRVIPPGSTGDPS